MTRSLAPALLVLSALSCPCACLPAAAAAPVNNVILFVADGLRGGMVGPDTAPTMDAVRRNGVWFRNSHSLFPTFTTPNASALATGHYLGDTGDFSNTVFTNYPVGPAQGSSTPFLENDAVLGDIDEHFGGNFLDEDSLLKMAHAKGYSTAAVGKLGPAAIQDVSARTCGATIIIDDSTGHPGGIPLCPELLTAITAAKLATATPGRGANGMPGDRTTPGTKVANVDQQRYFVDVLSKVLLPRFKAAGKPFAIVFWSRDPDGSQHFQGDSLGRTEPGINGPTSLAAIRNADDNLAALLAALETLGLSATTNVFITSDHGFSTISKESVTSPAAHRIYADVTPGQLPPGFLAIDLSLALHLPLFDPDAQGALIDPATGAHPSKGDGLIGTAAATPSVVVAANGGSDLIYLPDANAAASAPQVVTALLAQDYVSGIFVDDKLGALPGTLPLSRIGLVGSAIMPRPAIVVNFSSRASICSPQSNCAIEVADTGLQQGQGMHGSFSRGDTFNFMAAMGPGFRRGFVDAAPASNADAGQTLAYLLQLKLPAKGSLVGRPLLEATPAGRMPAFSAQIERSSADARGLATQLDTQTVGSTRYFDAAGFAGRTVGLSGSQP